MTERERERQREREREGRTGPSYREASLLKMNNIESRPPKCN